MRTVFVFLVAVASVADAQAPAVTLAPKFEPAAFATPGVTHPLFPLQPGTVFVYAQTEDGRRGIDSLVVTANTETVAGVRAVVVHDKTLRDGIVREDTFDWYATDTSGAVWYLGENTRAYQAGHAVSAAGSWRAGQARATAGLIMPAHPRVGDVYRQEFRPGVAEDLARVLSVDDSVSVPMGRFAHCVTTEDWSPLEPAVREHKSYCPGVGLVRESTVTGGTERVELITRTSTAP